MFKFINFFFIFCKIMRVRLLVFFGLLGLVWVILVLFIVEDMFVVLRFFLVIVSFDKQYVIVVVDYWEFRDDLYVFRSCL